eukprot:TRINITY_DN2906_c0_g1_i5.p2 TRINITY_DN2906_c0_g1~~TRINITY_DN2906_c0_g1_i5.p2  ORF type:complete len:134 (+),score=23.43 TRINITY_DN2906_c0_g1_i5:192-593(+)
MAVVILVVGTQAVAIQVEGTQVEDMEKDILMEAIQKVAILITVVIPQMDMVAQVQEIIQLKVMVQTPLKEKTILMMTIIVILIVIQKEAPAQEVAIMDTDLLIAMLNVINAVKATVAFPLVNVKERNGFVDIS